MNRTVRILVLSLAFLGGASVGFLTFSGTTSSVETRIAAQKNSPDLASSPQPRPAGLITQSASAIVATKQRMVELESGLRAALDHPSALHREYALRKFFSTLSPEQFPAALAYLDKEGGPASVAAKTHLFRCWADVAPEDAIRRALMESDPKLREKYAGAAAREWGRKDLDGAIAFVSTLPAEEGAATLRYLEGLALRRSESSVPPQQQLTQILAEKSDERMRFSKLNELFQQWAKKDLKGAIEQVPNIPNGSARSGAVAQILEVWMRQDPEAAGRWLDSIELRSKNTYKEVLAKYLASTAPEAAKAYALRQVSEGTNTKDGRFRVIDTVFRELYATDPDGAIAFFDSLPERTTQFHGDVWKLRLETDPARATDDILNHPIWQTKDVWWDWTDTMKNALEPLMKKDPRAAAELASKVPKGDKEALFAAIGEQWSAKDPTEAIQWAAGLPPGPVQDAALREFTAGWAAHDTKQATAWLNQIPAGTARSAAAEGFARAIFDTDPDSALEWLRVVPNVDDRIKSLSRAWGRWAEENQQVATDWLTNAPLSPQEKAEFEKEVSKAFK